MIRCHLSRLMDRERLRVAELARLTGLNRSTVSSLAKNTATRLELPAVDRLCAVLHCEVGDLFEFIPEAAPERTSARRAAP